MALGKQAKVLTKQQMDTLYLSLGLTRDPSRNRLIFLLSVKAGLRAKEIAGLTWGMVLGASGDLEEYISLQNIASKGNSGRLIPINKQLRIELGCHLKATRGNASLQELRDRRVVQTQRGSQTTPQVIVNMFKGWYGGAENLGRNHHRGRGVTA
jgi:integrase/recombinase XerD